MPATQSPGLAGAFPLWRLYNGSRCPLWNSYGLVRTFCPATNFEATMRPALAHSPTNALQRAQRTFRRLQQGSEPANGYSPLFCMGLLLMVVLMATLGH
jgi:hypothetical protein